MLFLLSLACIALVVVYLGLSLANPEGLWARAGRYAFLGCHVVLFLVSFADWARGDFSVTPVQMAADGYLLPLLPGALSLLHLLLFAIYRWDVIWTLFALSALEFVLYIPALILVEQQLLQSGMLVSFLAPTPVAGLILATLAPFLAAPAATRKIPRTDSRLWRVAYMRRHDLLAGIEALSKRRGWKYNSPRSILEAGSTSGQVDGRRIAVTTEPTILPFRYAVHILVSDSGWPRTQPDASGLSGYPWYGSAVSMRSNPNGWHFEYSSAVAIPLGIDDLEAVISYLLAMPHGENVTDAG